VNFSNKYGGIDMIPSIQKKITALVISLAIQVISLSGIAYAVPMPTVANLNPIATGVSAPVRIAVDSVNSYYYVSDPRSGGVQKFDFLGRLQQTIRTASSPKGVAVGTTGTTNGKLLVSQGTFVAVYDAATGTELFRLRNSADTANFQFSDADGIVVDNAGYIWVVDTLYGGLRVFTADGRNASSVLGGTFKLPTGLAYDKVSNSLVIVDTLMGLTGNLDAVYFYAISGTSVTFTRSITNAGLTVPIGVALEYDAAGTVLNRVYVVDAYQNYVRVYNAADLAYLGVVGSWGRTYGANGKLMNPSDVAFDKANSRLLVANGFGNVTEYCIDTCGSPTPPTVTVATPPATTATSSITLAGTVTVGATVTCAPTGSAIAQAATYGNPNPDSWSCQVDNLNPGVATSITVTPRKVVNGNPVTVSTVYIDPNGFIAVNTPANQGYTNATPVTITGTADAGSTVTATGCQVTGPGSGTTWSASCALAVGPNTILFTRTKPNTSDKTATTTVTLDTAAPGLTVSAIAGGSSTSTQLQNVAGTVTDNSGAPVAVTVNGQPATVTGGNFSAPVVLVNGTNTITVVATDLAGNAKTTVRNADFDFDPARPAITVDTPADGAASNAASVTISGKASNAATLTVAGAPVSLDTNKNWTTSVNLSTGLNTIEIVASSLTGKTSSVKRTVFRNDTSPALEVTVAETVPGPVTITATQDFAARMPNVTIAGTVSGSGTGLTLTSSLDGGAPVTRSVSNGTFGFNQDLPTTGTRTLVLTATDSNGTAKVVRSIIYDTDAPVLTVDPFVSGTPTQVSGTTDAGGAVNVAVKDGSLQIGVVTLNNNGAWSASLPDGSYNATSTFVHATDVAGNDTVRWDYLPPDGDCNGDFVVTIQDALRALRIYVHSLTPTPWEWAHCDVGPLRQEKANPDGQINIQDALVILRRAIGLPPIWWEPSN
jgi:hypothetical protein